MSKMIFSFCLLGPVFWWTLAADVVSSSVPFWVGDGFLDELGVLSFVGSGVEEEVVAVVVVEVLVGVVEVEDSD